MAYETLSLTVGRNYSAGALHTNYEYVIYDGENIVLRKGGFKGYAAAKRAGVKAANSLLS